MSFESSEVSPSPWPPMPLDIGCPSCLTTCDTPKRAAERPLRKRSMMSCKDLSAGEVRSHLEQCYLPKKAVPLLTFPSPGFAHLRLDIVLPRRLLLWATNHTHKQPKLSQVCAGSLEF